MAPGVDPNLPMLEEAASALGELLSELVLVGGCAAGLLITDAATSPVRPTLDVDLLVGVATYSAYHEFGRRLMARGFVPGTQVGDPLCRWRDGKLTLDVMPMDETILGFSNRWYRSALRQPCRVKLASGATLFHIDAAHFLATKFEAFRSRSAGDYLTSTDLEDVVVVVDGRASVEAELEVCEEDLRNFVAAECRRLLDEPYFLEALPGYFAGEHDNGRRARAVVARLRRIATWEDAS